MEQGIENGYSYQFQNISVGVYREAVPEDIKEMIEESASFGEPMSDNEIEYEMKRANHWATIGGGVVGDTISDKSEFSEDMV